jgi:hypothetical protein
MYGDTIISEREQKIVNIQNVFDTKELDEKSNLQKMQIANSDKPVNFYNLDMMIAVGYRVNSKKATEFRKKATQIIKSFITKGVVVNADKISNGELAKISILRVLKCILPIIRTFRRQLIPELSKYMNRSKQIIKTLSIFTKKI